VNTAIYSPSGAYAGIGFAIPVDVVNWVVSDLIVHGKLVRPALGVEAASAQLAARLGIEGVLILNVQPGSGADEAGLRPTIRDARGRIRLGDIIVALDGEPIRSFNDLLLALEKKRAGDRVTVTILRDGKRRKVDVVLQPAG
jgi:S1-C subfamily serine protease